MITILRECHQTGILKLLNPKKNLHLINFLLTSSVHSYENRQNDHQRKTTLIFYQLLSTKSLRQCMEISLENLYVDLQLGLKG